MPALMASWRKICPSSTLMSFFSVTNVTLGKKSTLMAAKSVVHGLSRQRLEQILRTRHPTVHALPLSLSNISLTT